MPIGSKTDLLLTKVELIDTNISEEGGGEGALDTRAEIPLQPMVKTMVRQVVLLQPMEDPILEKVDVPEGGCVLIENPHWSRFLEGLMDLWTEEPT
ncbi:hypothetical protein BTVI_04248 [Pitangus sulphuratus]|nr:hypothetical protein BTVI_04248 [Pitangus sulphuratus]